MFGNGLRPDIWPRFTNRFNIPNIIEFYGSTEGNSNILNYENRVGAVGFVPILFANLLPMGLIKVDQVTGVEIRGPDGLCQRCQPGEPGEWVGQIVKNHPIRDFHGYVDQSSSQKKILHNVWKQGDVCFRSGDILTMDEFGWFYFKGGFQLEFVSISRVRNHMTCYKFECSHWLKLQHSDWRSNLVKDFF